MADFTLSAPTLAASGVGPSTAARSAASDLSLLQPGMGFGPMSQAAILHKNIETYPGQLTWTPPRLSARQENKITRTAAVRAARQAERTSEHLRGGIDKKADMTVGASLRVHAQPDWDILGLNDGKDGWKSKKPFAEACQREFNNWAYDARCLCDAEGHYNFGGMMWMAFRNLTGPDAEAAGIIHYDEERMARYNARWATFIQVIDPDRIETPTSKSLDPNCYEGIQMDEHGRRIGFHVRKGHPSEGADLKDGQFAHEHVFVPRETYWGRAQSFHFFVKTRGGQMRGVTALVNSLRQTGMLDGYDDAYLGAAAVAQVLSSYIETMASPETVAQQMAPATPGGDSPWDNKLSYYGKAKMTIGGMRVAVMPPGDKVVMNTAARQIGDPTAFRNNFLRQFASAIGISFEQISNNYSDANYSSARAALLEVWRGIMTLRTMFTAHTASLIYAAVIEEAIARGRIQLPAGAPPFQENRAAYTACAWTGPGMGWIDPLKEAAGIEKLLNLKVTSRQKVAAERGDDYLEIFDQVEQEYFEADERGFSLDPAMPGLDAAAANDDDPDDGPSTPPAKD